MEMQNDTVEARKEDTSESLYPLTSDIAPRRGKKASRVDLPGYTYAELITMAIQSSPSRMMTIVEMQKFMRERFPCFRTSYKGWHNSIRHNLSARQCFYKVPFVDKRHNRRTHYWMINPNCSHCRDGNGLLHEAREWRNRRLMAKNMIKKKRRTSKKNGGSSTTRNADGLDSNVMEQRVSRNCNQPPCQARTWRTPPIHPMEYAQQDLPDQFTHVPQTPSQQDSDWGYPLTHRTRDQPACLECGDGMTGDCEYCVLVEIDEEPISPMLYSKSTSKCFSTRSDSFEMTSPALPQLRTYMKEEPSIKEDDAVLDDIVDKQDLFQTDDNFDASAYDVEGHLEPHQRSSSMIVSTSMPKSLPPSPTPSLPTPYPFDHSSQNVRCPSSHALPTTLPDLINYQPHPSFLFTRLPSSFNYFKEMHPYFFQDQDCNFAQRDRLVIDPRCRFVDPTKRFFRFPSNSSRVAANVEMSEDGSGFNHLGENERRSILDVSHCDVNCNDSLLIEPIHHRTSPSLPTSNPPHRFTRPVDSSPIPFRHGTPFRHPVDNRASPQGKPTRPLDPCRFVCRSNVNALLGFGGGSTSSAFVAASNDIRAISRLGELLRVSMVITTQHDYQSM